MTKPLTKKAEKALQVEANKFEAWNKKLSSLTGHIFTRRDHAAARAAYVAGTTAEAYAAQLASAEPVGLALHPLKESAVTHADKVAREYVNRLLAKLAEHGMDINAVAPYPDSYRDGRDEYMRKQAVRHAYNSVTRTAPGQGNTYRAKVEIVEACAEYIERFVHNARRGAAFEYDAFICKMVMKIGAGCTEANISGDHVWSYSILRVQVDGEWQSWKTQQIVNYSKFGVPYAQWPSRQLN